MFEKVYGFLSGMYGFIKGCLGFFMVHGCFERYGFSMRGTGASSFCVTHQPPQFGVQKEITRCNHFFFLKCTMFSDSWSSMYKVNCKSLETCPN